MPGVAASLDAPDVRHGQDDPGARPRGDAGPGHDPERAGALPASRQWAIPAGMLATAMVAYLLRNPLSVLAPTMWAEDGTLFFKDAVERGWIAILDPYAGQLVVVPRAIASVLAPLPAAMQPTLYAVAAALVAVLSSGIVLSPRWRVSVPLGARFACLLALLCMPGMGDTHATVATSHWWLGIGLLLLGMLRDPRGRLGRAGELTFVGAASTSGFVAIYGIPMLAVRSLRTRSRHSLFVLVAATLGLAIQIGHLLASPRTGDVGAIVADPIGGVAVMAKRVLATIALGDRGLAVVWPVDAPTLLGILAAVVVAALFAMIWVQAANLEVAALGASVAGGVVLAMWAVTAPGASIGMLLWGGAASRFFLIPKAALLASLLAGWSNGLVFRASVAIVGVLLVIGIALDYVVAPRPTVDWSGFARCIDETAALCSTVIPPGWTLEVVGRGP